MILLSSLVGNALIVIIVYKRPELRNTINYSIVNMAISDLIFPLTVIPDTLAATARGSWLWPIHGITGLILCKLQHFLQHVSLAVSVGSLVWIAVDRFVAVVLPMKAHLISSRMRAFAIASTWIVAMIANCLNLYAFELITGYSEEEIYCTDDYNTAYSNKTYKRVRTVLIHIAPLITMTILYCIIAVTLRRQDNALRQRAVHQKDQRKQRAIKMALCVMVAFYICTLPLLLLYILLEYEFPISCLVWFLAYVMYYFSSAVNPIICMTFVQSYRRGLKSLFTSCRCLKRLATYNIESSEQGGEITLTDIRITEMRDNLAFSET